jgi:hypothetical protein
MLSLYGKHYSRVTTPALHGCFYCGEPATTIDHCPPVSGADLFIDRYGKPSIPFYLLPCCSECNSTLGDQVIPTPATRAAHLERKLNKNYEKRFALWSDDELGEMSPMFRKVIKAKREALRSMITRIKHLELVSIRGDEFAQRWCDDL